MFVRSRAPLRLGLAGGGTDLSPFCDLHGGYVLNASIDLYAHAIIEPRQDRKLRFVASDLRVGDEGDPGQVAGAYKADLALHAAVYKRIMRDFNKGVAIPLSLTTYVDVPPGSGLGSSSTLVVAMVKAFVEFMQLPLGEYDIAHLAWEIERRDLGFTGGKQDQYAAAFGGVNFMEFYADDRVVVNPLRIKHWIVSEFETSLVLYFTGVSRSSSAILESQTRSLQAKDPASLALMRKLKEDAVHMKELLLRGNVPALGKRMSKSWFTKKSTSEAVSTPEIEGAYFQAIGAGAIGGKVSGAGGGGFCMFIVDPAKRMDVIEALEDRGGKCVNAHLTKHGTEGWRID